MTKTKKAIKEANKMADLELLKSNIRGKIKGAVDWLNVEVYGHKRGKILFVSAVVLMVLAQIV